MSIEETDQHAREPWWAKGLRRDPSKAVSNLRLMSSLRRVSTSKDLDLVSLRDVAKIDPAGVRHRHAVARLARRRAAELTKLADQLERGG